MFDAERFKARLAACQMSQGQLARRVGVSQQTISRLANGERYSSRHLHKIARELATTPEYLTGETDDPSENAPAPPPATPYQAITLQVLLPGEPALARMFEGLLRMMDRSAPLDEQAQLLAQRLPIGLSQLRDLMPATATPAPTKTRRSRSTRVAEPQS